MKNEMMKWALKYAEMGWAVFPCIPPKMDQNGKLIYNGKTPATQNGFNDATTDERQIKEWWSKNPDYNIGIACGAMSGGLLVIDGDQEERAGKFGMDALKEWQEDNGDFSETAHVLSGRGEGSTHYYFQYNPAEESFVEFRGDLHVDARADGGYIIAPPSLHESGRRYEWEAGYSPEEVEVAAVDDNIRACYQYFKNAGHESNQEKNNLDDEALKNELSTISDGRVAKLISLAGTLIGKYKADIPLSVYQGMLRTWNSWFAIPIGSRGDEGADKFEKCVLPVCKRFLDRAKAEPDVNWKEAVFLWHSEHEGEQFEGNKADWEEARKLYLEQKPKEEENKGQQYKPFRKIETDHNAEFEALPDFPVEALPEPVKGYVEQVATSAQIDTAMAGTFALSTIAAACMGVFRVQAKPSNADFIQPLNLYSLVCAYPSERKTEAQRHFGGVVQGYEQAWNIKHKEEIVSSQKQKRRLEKSIHNLEEIIEKPATKKESKKSFEDQLESLERELDNLEVVEKKRLIIGGDITPEALSVLLSGNNGCMLIMSDEKDLIDIASGHYSKNSKADATLLLKAYSGERYTGFRIMRDATVIESANLTISICIQPEPFEAIIKDGALRGTGFFERFLLCYPKSKIGHRDFDAKGVDKKIRAGFEMLIENLYDYQTNDDTTFRSEEANDSAVTIQMSAEGRKLSRQYEEEVECELEDAKNSREFAFMGWTGKEFGTCMRIAALIHIVKYREKAIMKKIEADSVQRAMYIMRYYRAHAHAIFKAFGTVEENSALYVWKIIREESDGQEVDLQSVYQRCKHRFGTRKDLDIPLQELCDRGYVIVKKASGDPNRPKETILINPEAI